MKQLSITEKTIGETHFYIKPFPAFTAANISGELTSLLAPALGGLGAVKKDGVNTEDFLNMELSDALPAVAAALGSMNGDKLEALLKKLIVDHGNVSVEDESGHAQILTADLANEVFCGEVENMVILAAEVVKINFSKVFTKLAALQTLPVVAGVAE